MLLCTDVAARGLDFPGVTSIIQMDPPSTTSEYVHRVGRTARMGLEGDALLMLLPTERPYVDVLHHSGVVLAEHKLPSLLKWLPLPSSGLMDLGSGLSSGKAAAAAAGFAKASHLKALSEANVEKTAHMLQKNLINRVAAVPQLATLACDAFRSSVRAYATHGGEHKAIFHIRRLHLGHMAFGFGLAESPGLIGHSGSSAERKRKKFESRQKNQSATKKKYFKSSALSVNMD